ncbi:MAG: hypothetical protein KC615_08460 [Anaerolineae bacterium]|nr:hypothetical protein [Anaerolineae bacterium]
MAQEQDERLAVIEDNQIVVYIPSSDERIVIYQAESEADIVYSLTWSIDGQNIFFLVKNDLWSPTQYRFFSAETDQREVQELTELTLPDSNIRLREKEEPEYRIRQVIFSQDMSHIAYIARESSKTVSPPKSTLFVIDVVEGTHTAVLSLPVYAGYELAWSSNGDYLAFITTGQLEGNDYVSTPTKNIFLYDGDSIQMIVQTEENSPLEPTGLEFSPDGSKVAIGQFMERQVDLMTSAIRYQYGNINYYNLETGTLQWLGTRPDVASFTWAPDNRTILYSAPYIYFNLEQQEEELRAIYANVSIGFDGYLPLINYDDFVDRGIILNPYVAPRLSPRTGQLTFLARLDNATQVFVSDLSGTEIHQITNATISVTEFAWSP